jgi:hypothetical protein
MLHLSSHLLEECLLLIHNGLISNLLLYDILGYYFKLLVCSNLMNNLVMLARKYRCNI